MPPAIQLPNRSCCGVPTYQPLNSSRPVVSSCPRNTDPSLLSFQGTFRGTADSAGLNWQSLKPGQGRVGAGLSGCRAEPRSKEQDGGMGGSWEANSPATESPRAGWTEASETLGPEEMRRWGIGLSQGEPSHSPQQAGFEFLTQHPPKSPKRRRH